MDAHDLLDALHVAGKLRDTTRHCYTAGGRHESVAEHSWRIALMAYFLRGEFPEADMDKVIRMCLIHDLGECFTGDIPSFRKTETDEEREGTLLSEWVDTLPQPLRGDMAALYREMEEQRTAESRIYKALDKLEAVISHNESDLSTWEPNEYTLNLTYGAEQAAFSPALTALREAMREETEEKLHKGT